MPRPSEHRPADRPLGDAEADELADALRAFGAASRLKLLFALMDGERSVEALSARTGLTESGCSQQLRVLRQAQLVAVRRSGRHAFYRLYDHHVPGLLSALRHHREHVATASGHTADRTTGAPA